MTRTVDDLLAEAQKAAARGRMQAMVTQQEVSRLLREVRFLLRKNDDEPDPSWSTDPEGYVTAPLVNRGTLDAD